jgi:membrane fusion protein (multidrug efflux system)
MADAAGTPDNAATGAKPAADNPPPPPPPPPPKRKSSARLVVGIVVGVIVLVAVLVYYHFEIAPFESTDDAFIEGHVTMISPRVSGPVVRLLIDDNQMVKAGDLLLEIDPADFAVQLEQARAARAVAQSQLVQAQAQTVVAEAGVAQEQAAVQSAEANSQRANADLERYKAVEARSVSRTQFDQIQTLAQSNTADLDVVRNRLRAAQAQVALSRTEVETAAAQIKRADAEVHQAELQLSYTKVTAPMDGRVTRRTVEQGAYVQTGQELLTLVPTKVWVVANFKEIQLSQMRTGQPVSISIDAYPGRKYRGKVDSFQDGTGSRFSLLPPENAVGNYVKVVQRVPVKIVFDEPLPPELDISPGLSVEPEVRVK